MTRRSFRLKAGESTLLFAKRDTEVTPEARPFPTVVAQAKCREAAAPLRFPRAEAKGELVSWHPSQILAPPELTEQADPRTMPS